jgi:hypothetical protein
VRRQTMRGLVRDSGGRRKGVSGMCGSRKQAAAKGIMYFFITRLSTTRQGKWGSDAERAGRCPQG